MLNQIILKIKSYLNLNIFNFPLKYYNNDPKLNLINLGFKKILNKQTQRTILNAVNKSSNQMASSGNASSSNNTNSGSVSSADATNNNSSSTTVIVNNNGCQQSSNTTP